MRWVDGNLFKLLTKIGGRWDFVVESLVGLLIRSIFRGKNARALQRQCRFSSEKSNELTDQQAMFCFNHAAAFFASKNTVRMLINSKCKAQTVTGNPTGNYRCQL